MRRTLFLIAICSLVFVSCKQNKKSMETNVNPLLEAFNTPFEVPPFEQIKSEHYIPAFEEAIKKQNAEIEAILAIQDAPTFDNTIAAFDNTGELLSKVAGVFFNISETDTDSILQEIAQKMSPVLSKHSDDIMMNPKLFARIKAVHDQKDQLNLNTEQKIVLEKYYKDFVRGGANLNDAQKDNLRKINEELSMLSLKFGDYLLAETNSFKLVIDNKEDLAGLPETVVQAAAEAAKENGIESKWMFTLHKPSLIPFITYSEKRDLREKIYKAYYNRGDQGNEFDNKEIISKMVALRAEKANLLGYKTHADFVLEENMAKNPANVLELINKVWKAALPMGIKERTELQKMVKKEGNSFKLESWDWWYYSEKLRKQKYDLDEEAIRPYFKLENVKNGIFDVSNKLFGLSFTLRTDIPKYNSEAEVYEVKEADGSHLGILLMDYHPRASKRGGAWCTSFREQSMKDGKRVSPIISIVCNFSKPSENQPSLLNYDEMSTFFHEFGHALHGLLSNCNYKRVAGTSVPRDFVELPSQIMENWANEPAVLKSFAKHYLSGEIIPDELIAKIEKSGHFNQGFAVTEFTAAALLDMEFHTLKSPVNVNVEEFEKKYLKSIGLIPEIIVRYRSTYFSHIFSGGYSSGYYSYTWSEILDADAFEAFKKNGIFDPATALSFRKNILEKGGSEDVATMYRNFRGADPSITPMLKRKGLI